MTDTATISQPPARRRVEKYLTRQLADIDIGQPLPSVRRTMRACGVSQVTVQAVLDRLREDGVIDARPRRGLFKRTEINEGGRSAAASTRRLDLIYCGLDQHIGQSSSSNFHADLFAQFGRLCGERGQSVRLHELPGNAGVDHFRNVLMRDRPQSCVVVGNPTTETDDLFRDYGVACVNLFPTAATLPAHSIIIDPAEVVNKQIDHLLSLGHRRIGYLHLMEANRFHRDLMLRREQFYRCIAQHSLPFDPRWVQYGGYSADATIAAMRKMMSGQDRPTAAIMGDAKLPTAYHVLREMGLSVGENFSLVGTDDLSLASELYPPATTLRVPRRRAVRMAVDLLDLVRAGKTVSRPGILTVELVVRASTRQAPLSATPNLSKGEHL